MTTLKSILVIDVGSSSLRAMLFKASEQLRTLTAISRPVQFDTSPPGAATLDPRLLRTQVEACIEQVLATTNAPIAAVGMATFVGNIVGIDQHHQPLTPLYTYADTRSADDVQALSAMGINFYAETGCLLHTAYLPARLRWLQRTEPHLFKQVHRWIDFATYLYQSWFGEAASSYSTAAWSGMLDRAALQWHSGWLDVLEISPGSLPKLTDYQQPYYTSRWPALRDVPFFLSVGDGAAANIGAGCLTPDKMALTLGTTAAIRVTIPSPTPPPVPPGLWGYFINREHHLIGGATSEGGNIFKWLRRTLHPDVFIDLEHQLATRPAATHGLSFLPLLAGERSPGWAAHATGTLSGLRTSTTPLDIAQAALEGVALRLALIAEQLGQEGEVYAHGGAIGASPAWAQIIANALNRPLHLLEETEVTARGTALLALRALGDLAPYPPTVRQTLYPQPANAAVLRDALEKQKDLYRRVNGNPL